MMTPLETMPSRRDGWWGIAFVIGLLLVSAMASLPTAASSGEEISAFYAANRQVIVVQQVIGVLLLAPFALFSLGLLRRARLRGRPSVRWLLIGCVLVGLAELATAVPPFVMGVVSTAPSTSHLLTLVVDLADAALFVAIALFAITASLRELVWLRVFGGVVAVLALVRAIGSPLGVTLLDAIAPILFVVFMLLLSVRILVIAEARRS